MKVFILAAGQGTRLRPLTNDIPKCLVKMNGTSLLDIQLEVLKNSGIAEEDIYIVGGYKIDVLKKHLSGSRINIIDNHNYKETNMVCSLMCAKNELQQADDVIVAYGDIIYQDEVLKKILASNEEISVVVDDGWLDYWKQRGENPLDDAETLMFDDDGYLLEIGQKTDTLEKVQSQYIGLMHFKGDGVNKLVSLCLEAKVRSSSGKKLWRTSRSYKEMYMTDLLQGLIDTGNKLKTVHINRGWFEVDCISDLKLAESIIK